MRATRGLATRSGEGALAAPVCAQAAAAARPTAARRQRRRPRTVLNPMVSSSNGTSIRARGVPFRGLSFCGSGTISPAMSFEAILARVRKLLPTMPQPTPAQGKPAFRLDDVPIDRPEDDPVDPRDPLEYAA